MSEWSAPSTVEHTFASGKTATLRRALPVRDLVRRGIWTDELNDALALAVDGELKDLELAVRLWDAVVMGMFVDPQIVPADQVDVDARKFPVSVLDDDEMDETIDAAFGGPAATATFPVVGTDEPDQLGGGDVAGVAVDADGAGAGELGGVRVRSAGGGSSRRRRSSAA